MGLKLAQPLQKNDRSNNSKYHQGLRDRVESTLRYFPTSINKKLTDSFSYINHYFDFTHEQQRFLEESSELELVFSRLNAQLNEETFVGDWFLIDQDCIDQFAKVTGDSQWIHTDPERAQQQSRFKTTVSQGFLTLALIPILTNSVDPANTIYPEARMVVNCGINKVVFPFPVKSGKRIRARTQVIKLTPMKKSLEIIREVTIEIEGCKRPACIAEMVLRLYF